MHLILFDIDGTLIHSHEQEADCFVRAVSEVTGITELPRDLTVYEHVTDTGIANECINLFLNRPPTVKELLTIEALFVSYFKDTLRQIPFRPIPGVSSLFKTLEKRDDIKLGIATGSYYQSALLKLGAISEKLMRLPLATANDNISRTAILKKAAYRAKAIHRAEQFKSITYIGDGPWDIAAVASLEWSFIGVASHYSSETLRGWGAEAVVSDYLVLEDFLAHLP